VCGSQHAIDDAGLKQQVLNGEISNPIRIRTNVKKMKLTGFGDAKPNEAWLPFGFVHGAFSGLR
ncbi:MAG: hypothetical protein D6814_00675, partial [Calditrichaeota bacterium]